MNGTLIQMFHWYLEGNGFLYKHAEEVSDYLVELGITAVWFPPAYKGSSGGYSVGYDPYDLYDLGEFNQKGNVETKYGSKTAYINAIKTLQNKNIEVYVDVVLNHKAGGDELETFTVEIVDPENRNSFISGPFEIKSYTYFSFPGRGNLYSDFKWNFTSFSGVDYALDQGSNIFFIFNDYDRSGWEKRVSEEKGNFDYLMYNDIEHRNPYVKEELEHWGKWYYETVKFDGVRLDAVKHLSLDYCKEWIEKIRQYTNQEIFAVGEYWVPARVDLLINYINDSDGVMSLFDSCLQNNFHLASKEGSAYDLRKIFDNTLVKAMPNKAVTLVDNHDTQPLQALEAFVEQWFRPIAYAFILLRAEGYPCVFYPDIFGAHYTDYDKNGNQQEIWMNKVDGIEALLKARQLFAYGDQQDYFEDANCVGWIRTGNIENQICAVAISNSNAFPKPMYVGSQYAGKAFYDYLGRFSNQIVVQENGWAEFWAPAGNVSVWVLA